MNERDEKDIESVLTFWFKETTMKQKYSKDPDFDELIREKFENLYWSVMDGETESWRETPEGRLAEVVILDQFSRNMFRDDKQSFAGDGLAVRLSDETFEIGADKMLNDNQRETLLMPYMHSESIEIHEHALSMFKEFGSEGLLKYAIIHKEIIDRFGRYPHRNRVLGRKSTPEETKFLEEEHSGFQ